MGGKGIVKYLTPFHTLVCFIGKLFMFSNHILQPKALDREISNLMVLTEEMSRRTLVKAGTTSFK